MIADPLRLASVSLVTLFAACLVAGPSFGAPASGRITAENFATRAVGGPDADAGIGDYFLSNGTLCAAVSAPDHEGAISPTGGVLIDLGHCGRDDDQFVVLQPMLNFSQSAVVPVTHVETGEAPGRAWIETRARFAGAELSTTYTLTDEAPEQLQVVQRARRVEEGEALFSIGQLLLHTSGQTPVFSSSQTLPDLSVGFEYPESDRNSIFSLLSALIASDLTVLVGAEGMPPISYGLHRQHAVRIGGDAREPLAAFSVSGTHFTFLNAMTNPPWVGSAGDEPGVVGLAQLPFMDLEDDQTFEAAFALYVGHRNDVASITDRVFAEAPRLRGRIDDPTARIHVHRADAEGTPGAPVTEIRPGDDGRFTLRLPPGRYAARALAPGDRDVIALWDVPADATEVDLAPLEVGRPAWVRLPGEFVGRLTFLPEGADSPLVFGSNLLGQKMGTKAIPGASESPWLNLAASPIDPKRVAVPAGRHRVIAVRGPEYTSAEVTIEARTGDEVTLTLPSLERIAPTPGWIAADFHVHSGRSFDSGLPQESQIAAFAASGAEVLVATEHDRIVDPRPAIERAALGHSLVSITGVEATAGYVGGETPNGTLHLNAFPMKPEPRRYRGGAVPRMEGVRLRDVLAELRAGPTRPFVQLNHPRQLHADEEGDGFFEHLSSAGQPFDPTLPLDATPNAILRQASPEHGGTDLDYHGVELMNGESLVRYRRVRADWLSLLLQGERVTANANSDSHTASVIVGLPRTYVAMKDDSLAGFDQDQLLEALRAGRAWGSTGPLLHVHLEDAQIGDLHAGRKGTLHVGVEAAPWVPVSEWRAYVNGELVHRAPITPGTSAALPLAFAQDAFVTVEVEGPAEGRYAEALPGFTPFAFTNPIFVDADGNGRFDAPGLTEILPTSITNPDRPD
ncbi:MAG: CehA/McbA family metallohydrolase [bacterium]|nr:CehA/McbA family metallohydrolase [bacterium]